MTTAVRPRPRLRGVSHRAAFISALTLAPIMIVSAPRVAPRFVIAVYALAIVGLFGISALYHRVQWGERGKAIMRRLDHSMIFVAIAGTYTPIAIFTLPDPARTSLLAIVWGGSVAGIVIRLLFTDLPYPVIAAPYVVVGWAAVFYVDDMFAALGVAGFVLIVVGGALYTVGAVIYAFRRPDPWPTLFGYHEIFHLFVIAGAATHYVAVAFFALPKA